MSHLLFPDKLSFNHHRGPDRTLDSQPQTGHPVWHRGIQVPGNMSRVSTYLNHTHTGVQENGSFGLFGDLLIFVEVQVIGAIPELGQVEIPPLEGLG